MEKKNLSFNSLNVWFGKGRFSTAVFDAIGLLLISVVCLCYAIFGSSFAELYVSLPFFNFPVFIGEIFLGSCLLAWFLGRAGGRFVFRGWHALILTYVVWILIKALWGYFTFGPLSLRNAALFYYLLFGFLAYEFYNRGWFTNWVVAILLVVLLAMKVAIGYVSYFMFPALVLAIALALRIQHRWKRYFIIFSLFVFFPYEVFFKEGKTNVIGNIVGLFFLASSCVLSFIKLRKRSRSVILMIIGLLLFVGFTQLATKSQVASLTAPQNLIREIQEAEKFIAQRKDQGFQSRPLVAGLYNPNKISLGDNFFLRMNSLAKSETKKPVEISNKAALMKYTRQKGEMARIMVDNAINELLENSVIGLKGQIYSLKKQELAIDRLKLKTFAVRKEAFEALAKEKKKIFDQIQSGIFPDPEKTGGSASNPVAIETDGILKNAINKILVEKERLITIYQDPPPILKTQRNIPVKSRIESSDLPQASPAISQSDTVIIGNDRSHDSDDTNLQNKDSHAQEMAMTTEARSPQELLQVEIRKRALPADFRIGKDVLHFSENNGYILLPDYSGWQLGGKRKNFTVDFWVRFDSAEENVTFLSQMVNRLHYWRFMWLAASQSLLFSQMPDGRYEDIAITAPWAPEKDIWYHIALVRKDRWMMIFVNGLQVGKSQITSDIADFSGPLYIGAQDGYTAPLRGYLDDVRITFKARWTRNFQFTPQQRSIDNQTVLFIHGGEQKISELINIAEPEIQGKDPWVLPSSSEEKELKNEEPQTEEIFPEVVLPAKEPIKDYKEPIKDYSEEYLQKVGVKTEEQIAKAFDQDQKTQDGRPLNQEYGNMLFRILIWKDMLRDVAERMPGSLAFGLNFGLPQRSPSLEILVSAYGEWMRDGWITPHNSFFNMIYRGGLVGIILAVGLWAVAIFLAKQFIAVKSLTGICFTSILIYWLTISNFLVVLELPHYAIPFWSLYGITLAYYRSLKTSAENFSVTK